MALRFADAGGQWPALQLDVGPELHHVTVLPGGGLPVLATTFGFGHLTRDVGLLPMGSGCAALRAFLHALQPLAFILRSRALPFVRAQLSIVSRLLAIVCDSVPLPSNPIPLVSEPLASREISLVPRESLLAFIELGGPAIELTGRVGAVLPGQSILSCSRVVFRAPRELFALRRSELRY